MYASQASVRTILTAISLLSEVTKPLVSRFASASSSSKSRHRRKEIKSSNKDVVSFCDDLRCGDFKYIIDVESGQQISEPITWAFQRYGVLLVLGSL